MTGSHPKTEILTGSEHRRRWTVAEKLSMVAEAREPGAAVSSWRVVAEFRRTSSSHGVGWRPGGAWR
jgi:transposase-like protein